MHFTDVFIRRPVLACVVSLLILLLGARAFDALQLRQYPEITYPVIAVNTTWPGANAALVKGFVTTPLLNAITSAEGIDYLTATSNEGTSTIQAYLDPGYDVDAAFIEISAKVNKIRGDLPDAADEPLVEKLEALGGDTLQYVAFSSNTLSEEQITDFLSKVIMPQVSTVEGMGRAELRGKRAFAMRIWLDPVRMAALDVTADNVTEALRNNNFLSAAGKTEGRHVVFNVSADTTLNTVEEFERIVVASRDGTLVRLRDVARVSLGAEQTNEVVRYQGKRTVFVKTVASVKANPIEVAHRVRNLLPDLQKQLPPGLEMEIVFDTTEAIQASIDEVVRTLIEASIIVIVVIFLFLGSLRSVLIPVVTIPLSLVGVLFAMLLMDFSVNLLTLLAMVLAIGLVVDDAIVVVENIQRHIEEGQKPLAASLSGAREIAFPVIAMTITLAAVYGPIGFLEGLTGTLFTEFAFTLAGAVIVSGIVALTLSPMMCSRLLRSDELDHGFVRWLDETFEKLKHRYRRILSAALNNRVLGLVFSVIVLAMLAPLYLIIPQELAPHEDDGVVIVTGSGPRYANTDYMVHYTEQAEAVIAQVPERERSFVWLEDNSFFSMLLLKPWGEREHSNKEVQDELIKQLGGLTGLQLYAYSFPPLPGAPAGLPMQYVLTTTADDRVLFQVAERMVQDARESGLFVYVSQDLKFDKPELRLSVDRDRAGQLGIEMKDLGNVLALLLSEGNVGRFSAEDRSYEVIPQADRSFRFNPADLERYSVRTLSGAMVPLSTVVSQEVRSAPNKLSQYQQLNSTYIGAMPAPGVSMSEALAFFEEASQRQLPDGFDHDYVGQARQYLEEGSKLLVIFAFSFILIYLVLAAQFESFRDPLIVLISVPMSILGALIPMALGATTMNIYTQIGLVTLIGLISKHGILIVDFANRLQTESGLGLREAVEEAASVRLRPILMTTAAMVFGVIPLLLASGAGAASRFSIGLVITAGMSVGTLFTLFIVPILYTYLGSQRAAAGNEDGLQVSEQPVN